MPELRNIEVEFLSLVDRAAVRDPANPTEPQKYLLWKSDGGEPEPEPNLADLQALVAKTTKAIKKMSKQLDELAKTEPEPSPPDAGGPTAEEAETMTKSDNETKTPEELAEQLTKAERGSVDYRQIGADYLASMSPAAYAAWRRGQESIAAGPYPGAPLLKTDTKPVDADGIKAKAEEIRKSDPTLSPYDAMLKALADDRAGQAAYLTEVRGR